MTNYHFLYVALRNIKKYVLVFVFGHYKDVDFILTARGSHQEALSKETA